MKSNDDNSTNSEEKENSIETISLEGDYNLYSLIELYNYLGS